MTNWVFLEKRPLFGRKITVPYIEAMGERTHFNKLITDLQQLGADVDTIMVGKILPIPISDFEKKLAAPTGFSLQAEMVSGLFSII